MGFSESSLKYLLIPVLAFASTYLLVPLVKRIAFAGGFVDQPSPRRVHSKPIARCGGVAIFVGFHLACALVFLIQWETPFFGNVDGLWWLQLLIVSSMLLSLGLIDDAWGVAWWVKLLGQAAAALFMFWCHIRLDSVFGIELDPALSLVATVVWFLAITNAFNLIDGLDGLASGLAAIAALGMAGAAFFRSGVTDALVLLALFGACIAFLRYNFYPASIFLGDSGSMLLGFCLAALGLSTVGKGSTAAALGVPLLAMGVPLFDTSLAVWRRSVRALSLGDRSSRGSGLMVADLEHLHHRLVRSGLSQRRVAVTLYVVGLLLVGLGLLTLSFNSRSAGIFVIAFVAGTYVVMRHVARVELWDSSAMLLKGLRRPGRSVAAVALGPSVDFLILAGAAAISIILVFEPTSWTVFRSRCLDLIPFWSGFPLVVTALSGIYSRVWSRARISEFMLWGAAFLVGIILALGTLLLAGGYTPRELVIQALIVIGLAGPILLSARSLPRVAEDLIGMMRVPERLGSQSTKILIYGAGLRGQLYLRNRGLQVAKGRESGMVVGFVDDDRNLFQRVVHGHRILGRGDEVESLCSNLEIGRLVVACEIPARRLDALRSYCESCGIMLQCWKTEELTLTRPEKQFMADGKGEHSG